MNPLLAHGLHVDGVDDTHQVNPMVVVVNPDPVCRRRRPGPRLEKIPLA